MNKRLSRRSHLDVSPFISKLAKVQSDKPAYKEKKKTDKGYVWVYDEKHVEKRWKEKKEKLKSLEKNLKKVREKYQKDLTSKDERCKAIAAIVGIMDGTAMRIGNEESAKEGTYGASTLKVRHVKVSGGKMKFDFPGKGAVEQHVELENNDVIKAVKDLMKGKKQDDFIFEIDGKKIWDRAVNRYLSPFDISAKDLRGFHANRLMKEILKKKKDFKEALEEVAEIVGHKASTLKNQYLDPELVEKHEGKDKDEKKDKKKASISIRAKRYEQIMQTEIGGPNLQSLPAEEYMHEEDKPIRSTPDNPPVDLNRNVSNIRSKVSRRGHEQVKITPTVAVAWKIIAPFLPLGAELSSGFRSEQDQANTILSFWRNKWNGYFAKNFPQYGKSIDSMHKFMTQIYPNIPEDERPPGGPGRVYIARPGGSMHQYDNAMDVHKIRNYALAEKIINWVNNNLSEYVSLSPLREGSQDNIHITIHKAVYPGPKVMTQALQKYYHGIDKPKLYVSQEYKPLLSKRAEMIPEDKAFVAELKGLSLPMGLDLSKEEKAQAGISPNVKVNSTIMSAWKALAPHLPPTAKMTSGERTPGDQARIIENAWRRYNAESYYPGVQDLTQKARILTRNFGYVVGPPQAAQSKSNKPMHLKGTSFDISGADLNEIASAVRRVSRDPSIPVRLTALVEPTNNAVHVNIYEASPVAYASVRSISSRDKNEFTAVYEDMIKSGAPEELVSVFEDLPEVELPSDEDDVLFLGDMGFGKDDEMGDWFEKSPIFRWREDIPDFDVHDIKESEASKMAEEDPERFFYRALHKEYPGLEAKALKNMIENNAKFYFVFKYHEKDEDEFKDLLQPAAEALSQHDVRAFFYYKLHKEFPELGRGAIIQLIDTNPDSFFDLGLQQDYPDFEESAGAARNIKDPNKVELEQPEWVNKEHDQPISLRDRNATRAISKRAKKDAAGVFAILPEKLAKQCPSLGKHDTSRPHVTVLYIGHVPKKQEKLLSNVIKGVLKEQVPFEMVLEDKVSYFPATKHSDGCKIAKVKVMSKELHKLHKSLKAAVKDAGIEIDDHFRGYKPHVTLEYMEPGKETYDGDVPSGSWTLDSVEIWNDKKKEPISLDGAK